MGEEEGKIITAVCGKMMCRGDKRAKHRAGGERDGSGDGDRQEES